MNEFFRRAKTLGLSPSLLMAQDDFAAAIARDPHDAHAHAVMGCSWHHHQRFGEAIDCFTSALTFDPCFAYPHCARAAILAACVDSKIRDGKLALADATRASELLCYSSESQIQGRRRMYAQVLAAAYAEDGDFPAAVDAQQTAISFAVTRRDRTELDVIRRQYASRHPYRDSASLMHYGPRPKGG